MRRVDKVGAGGCMEIKWCRRSAIKMLPENACFRWCERVFLFKKQQAWHEDSRQMIMWKLLLQHGPCSPCVGRICVVQITEKIQRRRLDCFLVLFSLWNGRTFHILKIAMLKVSWTKCSCRAFRKGNKLLSFGNQVVKRRLSSLKEIKCLVVWVKNFS